MNRFMILLLFLFSALLCAARGHGAPTYVADMEVRSRDATTVARVWARPGLLRMSVAAGRTFSQVLVDYRLGLAWALAPANGTYQEFPVTALGNQVPHFFDPTLSIERLGVPLREELDGKLLLKQSVLVRQPGGREYHGVLWESEEYRGYPVMWEDPVQGLKVRWRNPVFVEVSDDFFTLPSHYSLQKLDAEGAPLRSGCRERPGPKPPGNAPARPDLSGD